MTLDRRSFVHSSAMAAGLLPLWIARAFGLQDPQNPPSSRPEPDRVTALRGAWRRANAFGKPLLVLVVPANDAELWTRGQLLGAWLNHAGEDGWCDLALCEVACAKVKEAEQLFGPIPHEPWALRVDNDDRAKPVCVPIDVKLPAESSPDIATTRNDLTEQQERQMRQQIAAIAKAIRAAVVPDPAALRRLADGNRATLAPDELAALGEFYRRGEADDRLLVRAAATVRQAASDTKTPRDHQRWLAALSAATQQVVVKQRIPGSKWATSEGCGQDIEGEPQQAGVACGMGMVPEISRRFLYFFTG